MVIIVIHIFSHAVLLFRGWIPRSKMCSQRRRRLRARVFSELLIYFSIPIILLLIIYSLKMLLRYIYVIVYTIFFDEEHVAKSENFRLFLELAMNFVTFPPYFLLFLKPFRPPVFDLRLAKRLTMLRNWLLISWDDASIINATSLRNGIFIILERFVFAFVFGCLCIFMTYAFVMGIQIGLVLVVNIGLADVVQMLICNIYYSLSAATRQQIVDHLENCRKRLAMMIDQAPIIGSFSDGFNTFIQMRLLKSGLQAI